MDKFRLIEEIRKRPILWNSLHYRSFKFIDDSWKEVAKSLGGNVSQKDCKYVWKMLRGIYRKIYLGHKDLDPKKNYDNKWVYYKHMHFLKKVYMPTKSKLKNIADSPPLETTKCCNSSYNDNETIYDTTLYEIHITDDSEEEEFLEQQDVKKELSSNDDESCDEYIPNQQSKVTQYYNSRLSNNSTPKQNPVDTIDEELLNQNFSQYENDYIKETNGNLSISLKNNNSQHSTSTVQNIGDADYKFMLSFTSLLKSLTALQNLQFRAKMSDLILSFLTISSLANGLKSPESNTMQLAMDISDSDCNFLISFWPFMKSLSPLQNLQYRAKMSYLIIDILSKDRDRTVQ